jgi:hypothetical protein
MLDEITYQKNIIAARSYLTKGSIGTSGPLGSAVKETPRTFALNDRVERFLVYTVMDDIAPLKVVFRLQNLYVCGWYNSSNQLFLAERCEYAINPQKRLPYTFDYGELGFNQSASVKKVNVTLGSLNNALKRLHNAQVGDPPNNFKPWIVEVAIGLSEAMRFSNVMVAVLKGTETGPLNWDATRTDIQVIQST